MLQCTVAPSRALSCALTTEVVCDGIASSQALKDQHKNTPVPDFDLRSDDNRWRRFQNTSSTRFCAVTNAANASLHAAASGYSHTKRFTCTPTQASRKPASPSGGIGAFIRGDDPTHRLTAKRPIRPTSVSLCQTRKRQNQSGKPPKKRPEPVYTNQSTSLGMHNASL